jgi:hypothetical protein
VKFVRPMNKRGEMRWRQPEDMLRMALEQCGVEAEAEEPRPPARPPRSPPGRDLPQTIVQATFVGRIELFVKLEMFNRWARSRNDIGARHHPGRRKDG